MLACGVIAGGSLAAIAAVAAATVATRWRDRKGPRRTYVLSLLIAVSAAGRLLASRPSNLAGVSCRRARRSLPRLRRRRRCSGRHPTVPAGKDRRRDHARRLLLRVEQFLHRRAWRHAPRRPAAFFPGRAGGRSDPDRAVLRRRRRHRRRCAGRRATADYQISVDDIMAAETQAGTDSGGCDRPASDRIFAAMARCGALPRDGRARSRRRARPAFSRAAPRCREVADRRTDRSGRWASTPPASTTASRRSTKPIARCSSATSRRSRT